MSRIGTLVGISKSTVQSVIQRINERKTLLIEHSTGAGRERLDNNEVAERNVKKQKINHDENQEAEEIDFKQKWIEFLADARITRTSIATVLRRMDNGGDTWVDVEGYIRSLATASDIDEFEQKIEGKALVQDQEKACKCIKTICEVMCGQGIQEKTLNNSLRGGL
ncbi:hypothetical protein V8B55DRAFT_1433625 [Mucor lusitanicus]